MTMTNALAYYKTELISAIKSFMMDNQDVFLLLPILGFDLKVKKASAYAIKLFFLVVAATQNKLERSSVACVCTLVCRLL
jgi:hypothetical protein